MQYDDEMAKEKASNKCHECGIVIESESDLLTHLFQEHGLAMDLSQFIEETQNNQSNDGALPVIYETINTPLGCMECDFQGTNGSQLIKHYEEVHQKSDQKTVNGDELTADTSCYSFESEKPPTIIDESNTNSEIFNTENKIEIKSEVKNEIMEENVSYMSMENYGQDFGLKCPYCQGVFIVPEHLRDHIEGFHKNIKLEQQQQQQNFETPAQQQQPPPETEPAVCEYQAEELNFSDPSTMIFPNLGGNLEAKIQVPSDEQQQQPTIQIGTSSNDGLSCHICDKEFVSETDLVVHLSEIHAFDLKQIADEQDNTENEENCKFCGRIFTFKMSYIRHVARHGVNEMKCYLCNEYKFQEKNRSKFESHMFEIHKISTAALKYNVHEFDCDLCNYSFSTNKRLTKHKAKNHPVIPKEIENEEKSQIPLLSKKIQKNICKAILENGLICGNSLRVEWVPRQTGGVEMKKKDFCELHKSWVKSNKLSQMSQSTIQPNRDQKVEENISSNFQCDSCEKSFSSEIQLEMHDKNVHRYINRKHKSKMSQLSQSQYDQVQETTTRLLGRDNSVEEKELNSLDNFKCDPCKKSFLSEIQLEKHNENVHKPLDSEWKNNLPPHKVRTIKNYIHDHILSIAANATYLGESPKYWCELCQISFPRQKKELNQHLTSKIHYEKVCEFDKKSMVAATTAQKDEKLENKEKNEDVFEDKLNHEDDNARSATEVPEVPNDLENDVPQLGVDPEKIKMLKAYSFLDNVKQTFSDRPQIYNKFMEMMKELQGNSEMVSKITDVLNGYPDLLEGFNAFLPSPAVSPTKTNSNSVETTIERPTSPIKTTSTSVTSTITQDISPKTIPSPTTTPLPPSPSPPTMTMTMTASETSMAPYTTSGGIGISVGGGGGTSPKTALMFLKNVKKTFTSQPQKYEEFLTLLKQLKDKRSNTQEVYFKAAALLKDYPELTRDFSKFFPFDNQHQTHEKVSVFLFILKRIFIKIPYGVYYFRLIFTHF